MVATAKELRFNISLLFDVLSKGEEVVITYRGKPRAKLVPHTSENETPKEDAIFGMWRDRSEEVDQMVRNLRTGRQLP